MFKGYWEDLTIPGDWENTSYGNDACPSWRHNGYQIFIDHPDPKEREDEEWKRFNVIVAEEYGYGDGFNFETDDFEEVKKVIKVPTSERPRSEGLLKTEANAKLLKDLE